jgi:hypothetical protein
MKGVTGGAVGDCIVRQSDHSSAVCLAVRWNDATETPSTDIVVTNNSYTVNGGTGTAFVDRDSVSSFTPSGSIYILEDGTLAASPWQDGATSYSAFEDYQAAVEPSATSNIP